MSALSDLRKKEKTTQLDWAVLLYANATEKLGGEAADELFDIRKQLVELKDELEETRNLVVILRGEENENRHERDVWSHVYAELSGEEYGGAWSLNGLQRVVKKHKDKLTRLERIEKLARSVYGSHGILFHGSEKDYYKVSAESLEALAAELENK